MLSTTEPIRVAIACQGGGSHTAFTAGVLTRLFQADVMSTYNVVGLSGTSGGAICATLAWSALIDGDPSAAGPLLAQFWADNSASSVQDRFVNNLVQFASKLADYVTIPAASPYDNPISDTASAQLTALLERRIDFDAVQASAQAQPDPPALLLGAVDVVSGAFKAFDSRKGEITAEAILASAAIPTLFKSVHTAGGIYWDGLFSQNPPVKELLDSAPDEVWVIQINPQVRATEPKSVVEIADRRNELAGNLSLYQELDHIELIDKMLDDGLLVSGGKYKPIKVRVIEMIRPPSSQSAGAASKLNRDPAFLAELIAHGEQRAEQFIAALGFENAWLDGDLETILSYFADECEVASAAPFAAAESRPGADSAREFIGQRLASGVTVDLTKKQLAGDRVTWTVRASDNGSGKRNRGIAEARFIDGKITSFRLDAVG